MDEDKMANERKDDRRWINEGRVVVIWLIYFNVRGAVSARCFWVMVVIVLGLRPRTNNDARGGQSTRAGTTEQQLGAVGVVVMVLVVYIVYILISAFA
jgi:hypothetical protein